GANLWVLSRRPWRGAARRAVSVVLAVCIAVNLLAVISQLTGWEFNPEDALFSSQGMLGKFELNRMSPMTASLFALAGTTQILLMYAGRGGAAAQVMGALAILVLGGGTFSIIGYLYGTPLLYGGDIIPMAATTSAAFAFLGCGLVALNGRSFFLLSPLEGSSPRAQILRAFLPLTLLLILLHGYIEAQRPSFSELNPALFSALAAMALMLVMAVVALRVAGGIGKTIARTEDELRKSRQEAEFMADLMERSSQPWAVGGGDGSLQRFNQAFCDLVGYTRQEIKTINWAEDLTPPQWRAVELARLDELRQSGKPVRYEKQYIRKDGSLVPVELLVDCGKNEQGEVQYYYAFVTDISERKRAEQRFRILAEEAPFSIILFDAEGRVTYVNKWHLEVFARGKLGREFFLNKLIYELPGTVAAGIGPRIKKVLDGETVDLDEVYFPRFAAGHPGYQKLHGMPFFEDGQVSGGVLIREDITHKKLAEMERLRLEQELRQSQKMEAIGTLAGGIAHDFNNMLASVMGNVELSREDLPAGHPVQQYLEQIMAAGQRATELVRQILSFSRTQDYEPRPLRLALVIEDGLRLLRASIPSSVEISENISAQQEVILGDATQVQQILMNLCSNAAQAMEGEGEMRVGLVKVEVSEAQAQDISPDMEPGPYLRLSVRDSGQGISPEHLPRIFDPFFTTKEVGKGTGMGLSVVHGLVQAHGGFITAESRPGEGSLFAVYLPVIDAPIAQEKPLEPELPHGRERILFVDDEEPIAELGRQLLSRLGYQVTAVTSSIQALEAYRADPGGYDLVLTDYTMPEMTGDKLTKELLKINPRLPVIICTGYSERVDTLKARELGARDFVFKPLRRRDLAVLVRRVLDEAGPPAV
ncbi:MAG: PAS domain S-box protein, partial [Proteobacteria bacterium]|nr:PAS domain S-box protein [Pseudomonadota bacterium]